MNDPVNLENRLQDLAQYLKTREGFQALLGLGSVGLETERLDAWSDLDFFVIVSPGHKKAWIEDPSWLGGPQELAYTFKNTPDGYKLLWADGIFGEMAVFEAEELPGIPFSEGRVIWAQDGFDRAVLKPRNTGGRLWQATSLDYLAGELLTCLYVGMCRWNRGEKLSAWRFIQGYCLDRFMEMSSLLDQAEPGYQDPYNRDRRFEALYPMAARELPRFLKGYDQVPESALELLSWLESVQPVNGAMAREIKKLCQ